MHRILVRALTLFLAAATAPVVMAEEPPPGKVALHLTPSAGKPVLFVLKSQRLTSSAMQDRIIKMLEEPEDKYAVKRTTEFSLEVLDARPDGTWNAYLRFGRVEATFPNPNGNPRKWTSDGSLPGDLLSRMQVCEAIFLGGTSFPLLLGPGGQIRTVEGFEATVKKRLKGLGVKDDDVSSFTIPMHPEAVTSLVDAALAATPLPRDPVGRGDTWKDDGPAPFDRPELKWLLRQTFLVEAADGKEASLRGTGTVEWVPSPVLDNVGSDLGKALAGALPKCTVEGSSVTSSLRLSAADGLPLSGTLEAKVTFTDEHGGETGKGKRIVETATLERVAAWPSGKKAPPAPVKKPPGVK